MPIILDDFKLSKTIHPIERICEIIAEAEEAYGSEYIPPNQSGRPGVPELRLTKSYHTASQAYSNNAGMKQPKVYRTCTSEGFINTKRLVVTPSLLRPHHWQSYLVDLDATGPHRFKFTNMGPKNGAILENCATNVTSYRMRKSGYHPNQRTGGTAPDQFKCIKTMNVRVNDGTGIVNMVDTPVRDVDRMWETPEGTMRMFMRLVNYTEPNDEMAYNKLLVSISPIYEDSDRRVIRWRTLEVIEKEMPEITIDLTRPDFPLNEQDRIFASLMWSEQAP